MSDDNIQQATQAPRTKVGRLVASHDLDGLPTELERAWTGDGVERRSLRELATLFNERLTRAVMAEAGMNPLEGEPENVRELLAGDDATSGAQVRAERRLDREGVDVDELREAFVSHQAIHTYLTEVRNAEHEADPADPESRAETVRRLQGRTRSVASSVLEKSTGTGDLTIGEFEVSAAVHVTCRDCNSRYEFDALLTTGGCDCE